MTTPQRIQLKRTRGWRMPPNTVKVDRSTKWGNPFIQGQEAKFFVSGLMVKDRRHAFVLYQSNAPLNEKLVAMARAELRGKNLACWCPTPHEPYQKDECHAAVLIEIANS